VPWTTWGQLCLQVGLGDGPRKVFEELTKIELLEVVLPIRTGIEIHKHGVSRSPEHHASLLPRLGLERRRNYKRLKFSGDFGMPGLIMQDLGTVKKLEAPAFAV